MTIKMGISKWWNSISISDATEIFNLIYVVIAGILWLSGIIFISAYFHSTDSSWYVLGKLLFISTAGLLVGVLAGFLFGIPKTLQNNQQSNPSPNANFLLDKLIINTNLEQISDWL